MSDSERRYSEEKWRHILSAVEAAQRSAKNAGRRRGDLDLKVLTDLAHGLRLALAGFPPRGFPEPVKNDIRPRELQPIDPKLMAVIHVLAARKGLIDDPSPNKTVRAMFDVTRQAVQGWVRKLEDNSYVVKELEAGKQILEGKVTAVLGDGSYSGPDRVKLILFWSLDIRSRNYVPDNAGIPRTRLDLIPGGRQDN